MDNKTSVLTAREKIMVSYFKILARSVIVLSLLVSAVYGAEGFYVGGLGGATFVKVAVRRVLDGTNARDKVSFDPGYIALGSGGYGFENAFRTEGEISYRRANLEEIEIINDGGDGTVNGRLAKAKGHISALSFMANVFYDFKLGGGLKPYLGGGIGTTIISFQNDSIATLSDEGTKDDDVVFVYQIGAGIGYKVFQPLTIFLDYRYFDPSDPHVNTTAGVPADIETRIHNAGVGLRYNFTK